jgi:porphobilinogen deaminase
MVITMGQSTNDTTTQIYDLLREIPSDTIVKQQPAIIDIQAVLLFKEVTQMEELPPRVLIGTSLVKRDFLVLGIGKGLEISYLRPRN